MRLFFNMGGFVTPYFSRELFQQKTGDFGPILLHLFIYLVILGERSGSPGMMYFHTKKRSVLEAQNPLFASFDIPWFLGKYGKLIYIWWKSWWENCRYLTSPIGCYGQIIFGLREEKTSHPFRLEVRKSTFEGLGRGGAERCFFFNVFFRQWWQQGKVRFQIRPRCLNFCDDRGWNMIIWAPKCVSVDIECRFFWCVWCFLCLVTSAETHLKFCKQDLQETKLSILLGLATKVSPYRPVHKPEKGSSCWWKISCTSWGW